VIPPPKAPAVSEQIAGGRVTGSTRTFTRRPMRQSPVAPIFHEDRPVEVEAKAHEINNTINTKAVSVEQLNRFCDEADLVRPEPQPTGTEEEKLEAAKSAVMKQVRGIMESRQIQKAAAAAEAIFGSQNP